MQQIRELQREVKAKVVRSSSCLPGELKNVGARTAYARLNSICPTRPIKERTTVVPSYPISGIN